MAKIKDRLSRYISFILTHPVESGISLLGLVFIVASIFGLVFAPTPGNRAIWLFPLASWSYVLRKLWRKPRGPDWHAISDSWRSLYEMAIHDLQTHNAEHENGWWELTDSGYRNVQARILHD